MKQARNILSGIALLWLMVMVSGCSDPNGVFDQNTSIGNRNWSYVNPIKYNVKIDDISVPYNLYLNVRVTGDYKYSNLFVLVHTTGPQLKPEVMRYEIHLASNTGEWLGSGTGNLYSIRESFKTNYRFPVKGIYHFEIEQNMRDNPLHEVSDMGMRVEKASPPAP